MKSTKYFAPALYILVLILGMVAGCMGTRDQRIKTSVASETPITVSYLAGITAGGVVENNSLEGIAGAGEVDAISGATRVRFNLGLHREIRVNGITLETGLDYLAFDQTIRYDMPSFAVTGQRDIRFQQLRLPLTWNLHFPEENGRSAWLILKAGVSLGYTFSQSVSGTGKVPAYTFKNVDYGRTLGISFFPFPAHMKHRIGFYMDLYRGIRIYEDVYHAATGMGGHSYMKLGIIIW